MVNGAKIYFTIPILGGIPITQTAVSSLMVTLIVCIAGWYMGRNLQKRPRKLQVVAEKLVTMLYSIVEETMGKHNAYWAPYIGTLMISSLLGSLIGMTGIFRSTTADVSTTLVWALMTSFLVWGSTVKHAGWRAFLMGYVNPMNIISDIAQPISMAFRHFGNIMGGGVLTSLLYSALAAGSAALLNLINRSGIAVSLIVIALGGLLIFRAVKKRKLMGKILGIAVCLIGLSAFLECVGLFDSIPILQVGIPGLLSLYFDVFSGGIQALVFSMLTMVYVGTACPPPEEA